MKITISIKSILILFTLLSNLEARPVSYPGGWTLISFNDYIRNSVLLHYSPSSKYSLGYKVEYWNDKEFWINALNLNYLFKKINSRKSQFNLYFNSSLGILYSDFKENKAKNEYVTTLNISTDWETRSKFISYSAEYKKSADIVDLLIQKARIGLTPYIANYGKIHTWLMYEINYMNVDKGDIKSAAILRLFKSTHLFETGIDEDKNFLFNYIKLF